MYVLGRHIPLRKHIDLLTIPAGGHIYDEHGVTGRPTVYQDIPDLYPALAGKRVELFFERQRTAVSENGLEIFTKDLAKAIGAEGIAVRARSSWRSRVGDLRSHAANEFFSAGIRV